MTKQTHADYLVTELTAGWLMIKGQISVSENKTVLIQVREKSNNARLGKVIEEYEEERLTSRNVDDGFIAVMTRQQYLLMNNNYKLGGCLVGQSGYRRYASTHTLGGNWYGRPGDTARKLVRAGVPCPKELDTLIRNIMSDY